MARLTYKPEIFDLPDLEVAKSIILTPTVGLDTHTRWERETPYLAQLIGDQLAIKPGQLVVDYGCGIGRLAKELIDKFDCRVLGVDISVEMRAHAARYVGSNAFSAVSRTVFSDLVGAGLKAHGAFAVWVLQHCPQPARDISMLQRGLGKSAPVLVANTHHRCVPTREQLYASDGIDVGELLEQAFGVSRDIPLDPESMGEKIVDASWCRVYRAP